MVERGNKSSDPGGARLRTRQRRSFRVDHEATTITFYELDPLPLRTLHPKMARRDDYRLRNSVDRRDGRGTIIAVLNGSTVGRSVPDDPKDGAYRGGTRVRGIESFSGGWIICVVDLHSNALEFTLNTRQASPFLPSIPHSPITNLRQPTRPLHLCHCD